MNIYLAGPFEDQAHLLRVAADLERAGHIITARWLTEHGEAPSLEERRLHATIDLYDIRRADVLVACTSYSAGNPRGGRHFEAGYAYAINRRVIIFGPKQNIFHDLPGVDQAHTRKDLLALLAAH